jgi:hypothetical protein
MCNSFRNSAFILPIVVSSLLAGSKIEFDAKVINCGTVLEGKTEKLNAVFMVKNTGDSLLKLESVRPGCGCTVVKFDSLVQPGKTAKIESQVNIKGFRSGDLSKTITVTSNAKNEPIVRLTITAKVQSVIDISETFLDLNSSNINFPRILTLSSKKSDLKISGVSFKANQVSGIAEWQNIPLSLKFTWASTDSIRPDGSHVFKLEIYSLPIGELKYGEFTLKTNHADKPEIVLTGNINK